MKIDFSGSVERIEAIEEKLDIQLSAIGAFSNGDNLEIFGEITTRSGGRLTKTITIQAAIYNAAGQIVQSSEAWIEHKAFLGFDVFSISMWNLEPDIRRIRVWPKIGS